MTNCNMPSGITYYDQEEIIEGIAENKARQFGKISYFDTEDIKQEVRIKCWQVMHKYDPSHGVELRVFLSICADNKVRDIRRNVQYKHSKPCMKCPFWDSSAAASGHHDCLVYHDKMLCEKFAKHERYVQAKLSASYPAEMKDDVPVEYEFTQEDKVDFIDYIESNIPVHMSGVFSKLKDNSYNLKSLKTKERRIIVETLRSILGK